MKKIPIGEYYYYICCRVCSTLTKKVIDLGLTPLAGGFLTNPSSKYEKYYPLQLTYCPHCHLIQTNAVINPTKLFKNYYYFSSKINTLVDHFNATSDELSKRFLKNKSKLIEIGCNDGSFLKSAQKQGFTILGVDPATNVVKPLISNGLPILNTYFSKKTALQIAKTFGKADVIFSSNTLAHIENITDVFEGVKSVLAEDGVLIFEVHYLMNLISEIQYDMIYHEHQYYYSVISLQHLLSQVGLEIFDVKRIPIHAGSIRIYVQHSNGKYKVLKSVEDFIINEKKHRLNTVMAYKSYSKKIKTTKDSLLNVLHKLKKNQKSIVGYGASGRGTIMSNFCNLDTKLLDAVIDDSPIKHGKYMPGTHVPILDSSLLYSKNPPDYVLLFAWSFLNEIKKKHSKFLGNGGKFIIPLPKVKIIYD